MNGLDWNLSDVSETMLVTLACSAFETELERPILVDTNAVEIWNCMQPQLAASSP